MEHQHFSTSDSPDKVERRGLMRALDEAQALVWFDRRGVVVDANENALELFGYGMEAFRGLDYGQLCGSGAAHILQEKREWSRILQGQVQHTERNFRHSDGRGVWTAVNFSVLRNTDGTPRRVVGIFVDLARFAWKPKSVARVF